MDSQRRSARARKPAQYSAQSSEEDEGEEDPKLKKAKTKLRQMVEQDSDAESDFEKEMLEKKEPETEGSGSSDDETGDGQDAAMFNGEKSNKFRKLQLSESDSSEDDRPADVSVKGSKDPQVELGKATVKSSYFGGCESDGSEDDGGASQRLVALAGGLDTAREAWTEKLEEGDEHVPTGDTKVVKRRNKTRESKSSKESFVAELKEGGRQREEMNISSLLFQGEGVVKTEVVEEEDEVSREPVISQEGVQVAIALPEHMRRKKKKGFDVAAFIKREMGKARRELQVLLHKAHTVCLLAHLRHLDLLLDRPLLQVYPSSSPFSPSSSSYPSSEGFGLRPRLFFAKK